MSNTALKLSNTNRKQGGEMKLSQIFKFNIVVLSILSILCSTPVQSQEQKSSEKSVITPEEMGITVLNKGEVDARESGLTVIIKADKAIYTVGEPIKINITTQNNSGWYFRGSPKCNYRVEDQKPDYQVFNEVGHELPFTKETKQSIDWAIAIEHRMKTEKGIPGFRVSCGNGAWSNPGTSSWDETVTSYYAVTTPGTYFIKYEERGALVNEPWTVMFGSTKLSASTSIIVK
jgi:hypothetical protein